MSTPNQIRILNDSSSVALSAVAKTATFNSETINGNGASEIGLILDIGTVSGTSPTLDIKGQMSLDGGTTWLDTWPNAVNAETQVAFAQITATKETAEFYPGWLPSISGFADTSITPRYRFVFTIGGTNPSFTFTNVYLVERSRQGDAA